MASDKVIGLLGGGQLGRMLIEAANDLNIKVNVLDHGLGSAKKIHNHKDHLDGSFKNEADLRRLADTCDVVTIEIEHVDTEALEAIANRVDVQPSWKTIRQIKDKYAQKEHLARHDVATATSIPLQTNDIEHVRAMAHELGLPFMLKARVDAYDGRGNYPVKSEADFEKALQALGNRPLYGEKWSDFKAELAVMVVKTHDRVLAFPTVETVHEDSICKLVYAPARGVPKSLLEHASRLAKKAVETFEGKGIFGVEMFLNQDNSLLVNEIAPRPHNSGHYTIEACGVSQYAAHLRAILDLPIHPGSLELERPAVMLNILGGKQSDSHLDFARAALEVKGARVHLYDKGDAKPGRKMGHVTVTARTLAEAEQLIEPLVNISNQQRAERLGLWAPATSVSNTAKPSSSVAILMGSDSDMKVVNAAVQLLKKLEIPTECHITSAHRTPDYMFETVNRLSAMSSVKAIIAAAGGAAHLPGMAASKTHLPVIGLPVKPTIGDGTDSLLSMTNMPRGVPVATVGVNNAVNAALLAARIVGTSDADVAMRVKQYIADSESEVRAKEEKLQQIEFDEYLRNMAV